MSVTFMNDIGSENVAQKLKSYAKQRRIRKFGNMASQRDLYVNISEIPGLASSPLPALAKSPSFDGLGSRDLPVHVTYDVICAT